MDDSIQSILEEVRNALRFRRVALILAWVICLIGWAVVLVLPDTYESSARVFVDTRTALAPVIQGIAIQQDVNAQINLVQQSLLGEAQLDKILRETDLGLKATTPAERYAVMGKLRDSIAISVQNSGDRDRPGGMMYSLSYQDSDRKRSLKIVQMLLNSFVEDTLGGKREGSEAAQKFLVEQIAAKEQALREAEQRLADFKKKNVGSMPGAEGDYFTRLQNEMDANKKAQASLVVMLSRQQELTRQLHGEAPVAASASMNISGGGGKAGTVSDTAARIAEAQSRLDEMLLRFTDKHPDVISLRETIAQLKERQKSELAALKSGDMSAAASTGAAQNPVFQSIQLALNQTGVEIASLHGEISQHEAKIAQLRRAVNTVPEVEAEYARLNRDYDVNKSQYMAMVERLERAKLGQDAEATGSSVRFDVVDPPTASFVPVAPNRPRLLFAVFAGAMGAGAGVAFLLTKVRPVISSSRSLQELTGLPVIGVVSLANLQEHLRQQRRSYLVYAGMTGVLALMFGAVLMMRQPLASLMTRIVGGA